MYFNECCCNKCQHKEGLHISHLLCLFRFPAPDILHARIGRLPSGTNTYLRQVGLYGSHLHLKVLTQMIISWKNRYLFPCLSFHSLFIYPANKVLSGGIDGVVCSRITRFYFLARIQSFSTISSFEKAKKEFTI